MSCQKCRGGWPRGESYAMRIWRKKVKLKKAGMIRRMRPIETACVRSAGLMSADRGS